MTDSKQSKEINTAKNSDLEPMEQHGYEFIELLPKSKKPKGNWRDLPTIDPRQAFRRGVNVGVRLRPLDLVIDVDPRHFPAGRRPDLELGLDKLDGPMVLTGGGGTHYYLQLPEAMALRSVVPGYPGIDIKHFGGQVVAPGSIHPDTGRPYLAEPVGWFDEGPAPVVPDHIRVLITVQSVVSEGESVLGTPEQLAEVLAQLDITEYAAHDRWFGIMCASHEVTGGLGKAEFVSWSAGNPQFAHLSTQVGYRWGTLHLNKSGNAGAGTLRKALLDAGAEVPSWLNDSAQKDFAGAPLGDVAVPRANLLPFQSNDYGNALRLIARYGDVIRHCHDFKKWLVWDGRRWMTDAAERVKHYTQLTMVEFLGQALQAGNAEAAKFAKSSLEERRCNNAMAMARPHLAVAASELDQHPFLLNCLNGTVDLRTGELQPHDPEQFITKLVHFNYQPKAQCPRFLAFLSQIMGDGERANILVRFLQKAFGYSLTGVTSEKAVFLCWGPGDNGKSTLLYLFVFLLKEYSSLLQIVTLMTSREESNNAQSDLADLRGARMVVTSETEEGQRLAEGKLKRITQGMGKIKAARKYENHIEFPETHKLWIDANHRPAVRGTDNAIWNRLHLIPFDVTIDKAKQDRELLNKLKSEAEGVLAWAVQGAVQWWTDGLGKPREVSRAVDEWRQVSDQFPGFTEEVCLMGEGRICKVSDLHLAYSIWCAENEIEPLNSIKFNQRLESLGCKQERPTLDGKRVRVWNGIEIVVGK